MSRAWRIEYAGAYYHLMSRGNQGANIFYDDNDRQMMLDTLGEFSERFNIDIFAYVLMSNHYHLLVRTKSANLIRSMHWLGTTYTQRFNIRHMRKGHLFQGRYKSILVENDAYLLQLSYYIHRNPLRAEMVKELFDYRWSSYKCYAFGEKPPKWLSMSLILSQFEGDGDSHNSYRGKVQQYAREEERLWEEFRYGLTVGSTQFIETIRSKYLPADPQPFMPQQRYLAKYIDVEGFVKKVGKLLNYNIMINSGKSRLSGPEKDKRDLLIYCLWRSGKLTNEQIGRFFSVSYSAVSHAVSSIKSRLKVDQALVEILGRINSQFKL